MVEMTREKCIKELNALIALHVQERAIGKDMIRKLSTLMWNLRAKGFSYEEIFRAINYKLDQELEIHQ
jgi:hypothetical protein